MCDSFVFIRNHTSHIMVWEFVIPGNPSPWSSWPRRGEPPAGYLRMSAWQSIIEAYAIQYWRSDEGPGDTLTGPVRLEFMFYLTRPKRAKYAYPSKSDVTNLQKACEDALQHIIFENDSQVVVTSSRKAFVPANQDEGFTVVRVESLQAST